MQLTFTNKFIQTLYGKLCTVLMTNMQPNQISGGSGGTNGSRGGDGCQNFGGCGGTGGYGGNGQGNSYGTCLASIKCHTASAGAGGRGSK